MRHAEIAAWSERAPVKHVQDAGQAGLDAQLYWLGRVHSRIERSDLAPWCEDGWIVPRIAAKAAGKAASELAIVCAIWPGSIDDCLRPRKKTARRPGSIRFD